YCDLCVCMCVLLCVLAACVNTCVSLQSPACSVCVGLSDRASEWHGWMGLSGPADRWANGAVPVCLSAPRTRGGCSPTPSAISSLLHTHTTAFLLTPQPPRSSSSPFSCCALTPQSRPPAGVQRMSM